MIENSKKKDWLSSTHEVPQSPHIRAHTHAYTGPRVQARARVHSTCHVHLYGL